MFGVAELGELLRLVRGDADDVESGVVEIGEAVPEPAGLFRAAGRRRGWVEVHDDLPALVVRELHGVAVGVGKAERRGFVAHFESLGLRHRRCSSDRSVDRSAAVRTG